MIDRLRSCVRVVAIGIATAGAQAVAAGALVYSGEPVARRDGRHCAVHPTLRGPLVLVVTQAASTSAAEPAALLRDADGQLMSVRGAVPGEAKLRDPSERVDAPSAELGTLASASAGEAVRIRFRYRYERVACWNDGEATLTRVAGADAERAEREAAQLFEAGRAMREAQRLRAAGEAKDAMVHAQRAIALRTAILGERNRYTLLSRGQLGALQWDLGEHAAAAATHQAAYDAIVASAGDQHPDAFDALQAVALAHWDLGNLERADAELRRAAAGRRATLDADDDALLGTLFNLATLQGELGDLGASQAGLEELYPIYERTLGPDHATTLLLLNNLGYTYAMLGRYDDQYRVYAAACPRYRRSLGDRHPATLRCLNNFANAAGRLRLDDEALAMSREAYEGRVAVIGETHPETLFSLAVYAQALLNARRVDEAVAHMRRLVAQRLATRGPNHPDTLQAYTVLALGLLERRELDAAHDAASTAFTGFDAMRPASPETLISLARLAAIETEQRDVDAAIAHLQTLVKRVEERRRIDTLSAESQRFAFSVWADSYRRLVFLLAQRGATREAFRQLELSKARGLLETLAFRRAEAASGVGASDQAALRRLERRIASLDESIDRLRAEPEARIKVEGERSIAARELAGLRAGLRERWPKYARLTETPVVDAVDARRLLARGTALVSYVVRGERVLVFVVDHRGEVVARDLGTIAGLEASIHAWRVLVAPGDTALPVWRRGDGSFVASLARPSDDASRVVEAADIAAALGARLIDPLADALAGKRRLIVSPDGVLALLPFEALHSARGRLLERYRTSYVQSLSVLKLIAERASAPHAGARQQLFAMGAPRYEGVAAPGVDTTTPLASTAALPGTPVVGASAQRARGWQDLPGAAREIEAVSRLFAPGQRRVYVGAEATEARLRSLDAQHELARYRYLLFSAHGYLSMESPALSAIVLGVDAAAPAFDGYVTAAEWVGFDLASELIVLSACETASGRQVQGEGVMGLPFALFVAGNRNALLSLWPVQDDSTALFMQRFFARVHAGERHGDALAATKRELAADPRYRAPRHWAPFLLYGD